MPAPRVLLIGWDAADWKVIHPLLAAGKMPNIQRLVQNGASGPIATIHPPLSPMLWTSIATGKRPFKHGIHGFSEPTPNGRGIQPVTNLSRTAKALWNILDQNHLRSVVIGWWPSHPAEPIQGVMVSDRFHRAHAPLAEGWPLPPHAVHPEELADTIASLRVHPDTLTPEVVEPFIPRAETIDQENDKRLAVFLRTLAECMSIHSVATSLLDSLPWDFFAVYFESLDHFCHGFMKYHPPRQPWIGEHDFALYNNVVSEAYQLHDRMLGDLLEKAGENATVILMSDHGFHPDHLRPSAIPNIPAGPAVEHRDFGILAIRGPGIKPNIPLLGASILDIAPTILTLYGLPIGQDMDGKVLSQAFLDPPQIASIPTWEDGRQQPPAWKSFAPLASPEALEQMVALGYIERPAEDLEVAVAQTTRELRYNLGESYQDANRHVEAHRIFSALHAAYPDEQRFAVRLFVSCQALGLREEMQRILKALPPSPVRDYLQAQLLMAQKRYPEALAVLERVATAPSIQTAELYLRLRRWPEAQQVYEDALSLDPDNVHAYLGLSRIALHKKDFHAAASSALDAIQRIHQLPQAHYLLGRALAGLRQYDRAAEAYRAAISFNPNFPEAHLRLAALLDPASACEHRRLARQMRNPEPVIIVTGLPRSGTSMLMQMLGAGGLAVVSDGLRQPDAANPHGYLEYEPVKTLLNDSDWLFEARGKAVKIVAPLLPALPPGLTCRVILIERDLDEVLDSQERMLKRREAPERRQLLKDEYTSILVGAKAMLAQRPNTQLLLVKRSDAISDPLAAAQQLNAFLGGTLDTARMAAAIDLALVRPA